MITNIGLDHTDWLGDTIEKLLLKSRYYPTSYSCHFAGEQSLPQAIQDKANSSQATLYAINRDYFYKLADDGKHWYFASEGTTLRLPLGTLAIENIAGAVAAVLNSGLEISQLALEEGITNARLAERFEVRQVNGKTIIFDADTILMVLNFC